MTKAESNRADLVLTILIGLVLGLFVVYTRSVTEEAYKRGYAAGEKHQREVCQEEQTEFFNNHSQIKP